MLTSGCRINGHINNLLTPLRKWRERLRPAKPGKPTKSVAPRPLPLLLPPLRGGEPEAREEGGEWEVATLLHLLMTPSSTGRRNRASTAYPPPTPTTTMTTTRETSTPVRPHRSPSSTAFLPSTSCSVTSWGPSWGGASSA